MKLLRIYMLLLISSSLIYACTSAEASKPGEIKADVNKIEQLKDIGFVNTSLIVNYEVSELKKYYFDKAKLKFLSENEVQSIVTENNLIIGPIENFIGNIPNNNVNEILENSKKYKNLRPENPIYITMDNRSFTEEEYNKLDNKSKAWIDRTGQVKNKPIYLIAAPLEQFVVNDGQEINNKEIKNKPPVDPIVLIKVDRGYIELSRWLN